MAAELRAYNPSPSERAKGVLQDLLMGLGADSYTGGRIAGSIKDLLGFTPVGIPMAAADMKHAGDQGDLVGAAIAGLGVAPGVGQLGKAVGKVPMKLDPTEEALKAIEEALGTATHNMSKPVVNKTASYNAANEMPGSGVNYGVEPTGKGSGWAIFDFNGPGKKVVQTGYMNEAEAQASLDKALAYTKGGPVNWNTISDDIYAASLKPSAEASLTSVFDTPWTAADAQAEDIYKQAFKGATPAPAPAEFISPQMPIHVPPGVTVKPSIHYPNTFDLHDSFGPISYGHASAQAAADEASKIFTDKNIAQVQSFAAPAAPKKIAPVDSGVDMMVWLDKNPGASINDYLGVPMAPVKVPKNPAVTQADNIYAPAPKPKRDDYVPPRPNAAEVPNPAPGPDIPWTIQDTDEAIRQSNREAMGYTTQAFHGTPHTFQPREDGTLPIGGSGYFYSSANPVLGETYASTLMRNPDKGYNAIEGAQLMPLWLDTSQYHKYDAGGRMWNDPLANRKALDEARALGAPGVQVDNVWDEYGSTRALPSPQTIFITMNPEAGTVRSKAAKFDPSKKGLNDILAGLGGIGVGGVLLGGQGNGE